MSERSTRQVVMLFFLILLIGAAAVLLVPHLTGTGGAPQPRQGWETYRPPGDVEALVIRGGRVIAGGSDGILVLDRINGQPIDDSIASLPVGRVQALLLDRNGSLWIGHETGLTRVTGSTITVFNSINGLPDGEVLSLMEDREGRVWAGTWKGAAVHEGERWRVLTMDDGLLDNNVHAMREDRSGGIWFGSYVAPRGGISYLRDGRWQHFTRAEGLPHPNVVGFLEDRDGSVWAGTGLIDRGGAARFVEREGTWSIAETLTAADGLAGNKVRALFQDRDGVLWFGSEYDGLTRREGTLLQGFTEADGLAHNEVKCMAQDPDGDLWIGTRNGITRIRSRALHAPCLSGTAPLSVQFTDQSTGTPASWAWHFGDDATSAASSPVHTFTAPGTYLVRLTVANSGGTDSSQQTVTVTAPVTTAPPTTTAPPFTGSYTGAWTLYIGAQTSSTAIFDPPLDSSVFGTMGRDFMTIYELSGTLSPDGRTLQGTWDEIVTAKTGTFRIVLAMDGNTFSGIWVEGGTTFPATGEAQLI